jgi:hypothetical protein
MRATPRIICASLALVLITPPAFSQSISLGLRGTGSFPTGSFSNTGTSPASATLIDGAKSGFGYGIDAGISLGMLGLYGSFDHIKFDCATNTCQTDGKYTLQGVTVGVKLSTPDISLLRPYVKGGVTFNELQGGYGGSSSNRLTTDKTPGYEVGVGADIQFLGLVSVSPQLRYVGQNLKAKIPGITTPATATEQGVKYFTFDLGLSVHTPFGGR